MHGIIILTTILALLANELTLAFPTPLLVIPKPGILTPSDVTGIKTSTYTIHALVQYWDTLTLLNTTINNSSTSAHAYKETSIEANLLEWCYWLSTVDVDATELAGASLYIIPDKSHAIMNATRHEHIEKVSQTCALMMVGHGREEVTMTGIAKQLRTVLRVEEALSVKGAKMEVKKREDETVVGKIRGFCGRSIRFATRSAGLEYTAPNTVKDEQIEMMPPAYAQVMRDNNTAASISLASKLRIEDASEVQSTTTAERSRIVKRKWQMAIPWWPKDWPQPSFSSKGNEMLVCYGWKWCKWIEPVKDDPDDF